LNTLAIEQSVPTWTPAGELTRLPPANDNARPLMIGLTGKRNVGKSTAAEILEAHYGFQKVHAFGAGKEAAEAWFNYIGGDGTRMVYGDLKDVPSHHLPGEVPPRYFLERFGHFMGQTMGVEFTLGLEIGLARARNPRAPIVVESVVYEGPWFKAQGGILVRLERPGHDGPAGIESDAVQASLAADYTISATSLDELETKVMRLMEDEI
jgi:hypothetical protein